MAKLELSISATDVIKSTVQRIMSALLNGEVEFEESVSEEYKKGFCDFGNAIVELLNKMEGEN